MTTVPFSMRMNEVLREHLDQEAKRTDRPASYLVHRALESYLEGLAKERSLLEERVIEANAGKFVSSDRVLDWAQSWGSKDELERPTSIKA